MPVSNLIIIRPKSWIPPVFSANFKIEIVRSADPVAARCAWSIPMLAIGRYVPIVNRNILTIVSNSFIHSHFVIFSPPSLVLFAACFSHPPKLLSTDAPKLPIAAIITGSILFFLLFSFSFINELHKLLLKGLS